MQPIAVAVGLTVTILALTALLAGPHVAYLALHTRVLVTEYWPSLTVYSALAVVTLIVAIYATARAVGLATSGGKSILWNGRSDAVRAAIRSWPNRCSTRTGESLTNDDRASGHHRTRLENVREPAPTHDHKETTMHPHRSRIITALAAVFAVGLAEAPVFAQGVSPWLNAVDVLQQAFTGPLARGLSLIAIVIGGLMFAFGEGGSKKAQIHPRPHVCHRRRVPPM